MGDEEIIKRRLLIDGDGTGDDRRLNMLLKNFIKWCNGNGGNGTNTNDPQDQIFFDRLMAQWAQCTFAGHKSKFALQMIDEEIKNYEKLSTDIDRNIEDAKEELDTCKLDLLVAKKIRKNREEYDALAKVIISQPDRKETAKQLEKLSAEMNELKQEAKHLDSKIQKRQKGFKILMTAVRELEISAIESSDEEIDDLYIGAKQVADNIMDVVDGAFVREDDMVDVQNPIDVLELQPVSSPKLEK